MSKEVAISNSNLPAAGLSTGYMTARGFEDVPVSELPMPTVRIVQPTSQDVTLEDGNEAPLGWFFFDNQGFAKSDLHIALIKAKKISREFKDKKSGELQKRITWNFLFIERESGKPYVISFSPSSFRSVRSLLALVNNGRLGDGNSEREIIITSEKQENDMGKYYVAQFQIGELLSEDEYQELLSLWMQYGSYFSKEDSVEQEEAA